MLPFVVLLNVLSPFRPSSYVTNEASPPRGHVVTGKIINNAERLTPSCCEDMFLAAWLLRQVDMLIIVDSHLSLFSKTEGNKIYFFKILSVTSRLDVRVSCKMGRIGSILVPNCTETDL